MTIKHPDLFESWEFDNQKMRKSLPSDILAVTPKNASDEEFKTALLSLAMIFNDLRGLIFLDETIKTLYKNSGGPTVSEHTGEREGIIEQIYKILLATVHESIVFVRDSHKTLESELFQKLLKRTSQDTQDEWKVLIKIAKEEPLSNPDLKKYEALIKLLKLARNNVGFHYQTNKKLNEGFRRFFYKKISDVELGASMWAYHSIKKSDPLASRYYYVDAALQGYYHDLFGDEKSVRVRTDEIFDVIALITRAIQAVLVEFHSTLPNR